MSDPLVEQARKIHDDWHRLQRGECSPELCKVGRLASLVERAVRERDAARTAGDDAETRESALHDALARAEKAEAELARFAPTINAALGRAGQNCWFGDCEKSPASLCGVCDAWFCDAHFDHGSPGDGPHQGGR